MTSIQDYAKAVKNNARSNSNKCVVYTRVSSKDQADNNGSLSTQMKYCLDFVEKNNLELIECFGGTYESAKSDDNRKEFQRMLSFVRKTKDTSTIVVYSLDRFSRTGGNASKLIEDLRVIGVEVRAVQQDFNTEKPSGKMMQEMMMVFAKADNEMRREKTVTGMLEKLKQGYCIFTPPKGYTNLNKHSTADKQKLIINEEGKLIRRAYKMRVQGFSYQAIVDKLTPLGFTTKRVHMGQLLKNPFYAGFISHKLLDGEIIKGKHLALISEEEFLLANQMSKHPTGETIRMNKAHDELPLKTFMKEDETGIPFTGYIAKKGSIPYYKNCYKGKAVNVSARKVNAAFEDLLNHFEIDASEIPEIKEKVLAQLEEKLADQITAEKKTRKELAKLKSKMDSLTEKFVEGLIDQDSHQKLKEKYRIQIEEIDQELQKSPIEISNLEKVVDKGLKICRKPQQIWASGSFEQKRIFQDLLFPEGIYLNKEKRIVRTSRVNEIISQIARQSSDTAGNKKDKPNLISICPI